MNNADPYFFLKSLIILTLLVSFFWLWIRVNARAHEKSYQRGRYDMLSEIADDERREQDRAIDEEDECNDDDLDDEDPDSHLYRDYSVSIVDGGGYDYESQIRAARVEVRPNGILIMEDVDGNPLYIANHSTWKGVRYISPQKRNDEEDQGVPEPEQPVAETFAFNEVAPDSERLDIEDAPPKSWALYTNHSLGDAVLPEEFLAWAAEHAEKPESAGEPASTSDAPAKDSDVESYGPSA